MDPACQLLVKDICETSHAHEKPDLLINCFGGTDYFTMTDALEKEFMKDISQAATTKSMFNKKNPWANK